MHVVKEADSDAGKYWLGLKPGQWLDAKTKDYRHERNSGHTEDGSQDNHYYDHKATGERPIIAELPVQPILLGHH